MMAVISGRTRSLQIIYSLWHNKDLKVTNDFFAVCQSDFWIDLPFTFCQELSFRFEFSLFIFVEIRFSLNSENRQRLLKNQWLTSCSDPVIRFILTPFFFSEESTLYSRSF